MSISLFLENVFAQNGAATSLLKGKSDISPMNGSGTLGAAYNQSACGLNYVQASQLTETRSATLANPPFNTNGTGLPVTLPITGIPPCATILKAYVWYTVSCLTAPPATTVNLTNPASAVSNNPATNIGTHGDKVWGEMGSVAYRADVTANVTSNGNYVVDITGFSDKNREVDGVTLMIIYKDNSATYQGSLVIWDGCLVGCYANPPFYGVPNVANLTMNGIAACGNSTTANAFIIVSDMQNGGGVNPPTHQATLNGATGTYPNNFYNFNVTNTTVTSGQSTSAFGLSSTGGDCFGWSVMGLYYQTTSCVTCTPANLTLTVTPTNATCGTQGSATASASGSSSPYTYTWSTGATGPSVNNLAAGSYSVTVQDATGCTTSQPFTITSAAGASSTLTSTPTSCNGGNDGSATANTTGGQTPYTYAWATTPVQITATVTGLAVGTYSVQVADASGCSTTYSVAITQPAVMTATTAATNISCFGGNDGSATVAGGGGTSPYTYTWSPSGGAGATASGLSAGNYSVVVTDSKGCTESSSAVITEPTAVTLNPSATPAACGASNGSATAAAGGGTGPYTYLWNTTPPQSTATATGLAGGTYSVVATDSKGCTNSLSVPVPSSGGFSITPSQTNLTCFGSNNGTASVNTTGGTLPYTFLWSTNPVQTSSSVSNLAAGTYSVGVSDAAGCVQSAVYTITEPTAVTGNITNPVNVSCFGGSNGSAIASGSGGTGTITYSWNTSPVQTSPTASNLAAGNYAVTIQDANACSITQSVTITQPSAITLTTSATPADCGVKNGTAIVSPSGGAAPYTYLWLTNPVETTALATGLGGGTYTVIVTDGNGCTQSQSVLVGGGNAPTADFNFSPQLVNIEDPLVIFTDLSSGNPSVWSWDFGDPASGANNVSALQHPTHAYADTGTYCITLAIADQTGMCKDTLVKCLKAEAPFTFYIPNTFTPNGDGYNEFFLGYGTYIKAFQIMIFDRWGNKIFESNDINNGWNGKVVAGGVDMSGGSGKLAQQDVYIWKVKITDTSDKKHDYVGHVNIVR